MPEGELKPTLLPLGDAALLVRFAETLSDEANLAALALARTLEDDLPDGVEELAPGLVSVLLRTRPGADLARLAGEVRLRLGRSAEPGRQAEHDIVIAFDGEDVGEVATLLQLGVDAFVARHNTVPLRVLATGFAPGFVYCGFHVAGLAVPRRDSIRLMVPAGTVLFAAGQTAIAATPIRTGWHVIGHTKFRNFDAATDPPTRLKAGDIVRFVAAS
jgi:KipI family sensor histidine kinase inhibitor